METKSEEYSQMLHNSIVRKAAHTYALERIEQSLKEISINSKCITDVYDIVSKISKDHEFSSQKLTEIVFAFRKKWQVHLNRIYFRDYEKIRCEFIREFVLSEVRDTKENLGNCLDIGCGRGCITESLVSNGDINSAHGIDAVNFDTEWLERKANRANNGELDFSHVPVENIGAWLNADGEKFDTVFLFYVLHHSTDYWVARTLRDVKQYLKRDGVIVILEDSFIIDSPPKSDPYELYKKWKHWIESDKPYCLSIGFDVQVILDFVAVQLLAGFAEVSMPCNYKIGSEWELMFEEMGFNIVKKSNIGFPKLRDIDVPQAVFILKS